jgi:hypothetical protein
MLKSSLLLGALAGVQAGPAVTASKICVNNDAGFVMYWWQYDLNTGARSDSTEHYPID